MKPVIGFKGWLAICCVLFLVAMAAEQVWKYRTMRVQIGLYAYSVPHALLQLGELDEFIGRVEGFRWNMLPQQPDGIKGYQPRYLIARETVPGVTETQWRCTYFFVLAPTRPIQITPAPFPDFVTMDPDAVMK